MTHYNFVLTLPKPDVAGILTACGYAIRESITLVDALEELGFAGIDTDLIKDVSDDQKLALLALLCLTKLSLEV